MVLLLETSTCYCKELSTIEASEGEGSVTTQFFITKLRLFVLR